MDKKLQELIKEYLVKLPKETQDVIMGFPWAEISNEIGEDIGLVDNELIDLQTETAIVLLGMCTPEEYVKNLENEVGVTKNEAEKIMRQAKDKIFDPMALRLESVIKNKITTKETPWDQNINFIISGGSYFFFLDQPMKEGTEQTKIDTPSKNIADLREKLSL